MNRNQSVRGLVRCTALALAAAAACTTTAFAADQVKVRRSPDPEVTYRRLQVAAAELCGQVDRRDLVLVRAWNRCYEHNLDSAVMQMQEPELLAIHRQHRASSGAFAG
jgi:hypothetical protein